MKKFYILLLLCLTANVHAVTLDQAKIIYRKILKANKIVIAPRLKVVDFLIDAEGKKNYNNAATGFPWQHIVITRKFLVEADEQKIAFVLGHELGHAKSFHNKSTHKNEYIADAKGAKYTNKAGYDHCLGSKFFKNKPVSPSHPAGNDRIKSIGC